MASQPESQEGVDCEPSQSFPYRHRTVFAEALVILLTIGPETLREDPRMRAPLMCCG